MGRLSRTFHPCAVRRWGSDGATVGGGGTRDAVTPPSRRAGAGAVADMQREPEVQSEDAAHAVGALPRRDASLGSSEISVLRRICRGVRRTVCGTVGRRCCWERTPEVQHAVYGRKAIRQIKNCGRDPKNICSMRLEVLKCRQPRNETGTIVKF